MPPGSGRSRRTLYRDQLTSSSKATRIAIARAVKTQHPMCQNARFVAIGRQFRVLIDLLRKSGARQGSPRLNRHSPSNTEHIILCPPESSRTADIFPSPTFPLRAGLALKSGVPPMMHKRSVRRYRYVPMLSKYSNCSPFSSIVYVTG